MRRILSIFLALFWASNALADGQIVYRTIQDGSGTHSQAFWDESGTGAGPFDLYVVNANTISAGGSTAVAWSPNGSSAGLSVTTTTSNVALPTGSNIIITNIGSNVAYVALGTSNSITATTSNIPIPPNYGWVQLAVGSNTYIAGISTGGTTTLNIQGGSGLASGVAGGAVVAGGGPTSLTNFVPSGLSQGISATTTTTNAAIPAGANIIITNLGSVAAYVKMGTLNSVQATTSDLVVPPNFGWVELAVGSNGYIAAITASGTTTLNVQSGSGLAVGSTAASIASVGDIGLSADAACGSDTGTCSLIALFKRMNQNASAPAPAGTNHIGSVGIDAGTEIMGKVGIDQTTPGTTNAVQTIAGTTGGATPYTYDSAASNNSTSMKASAGNLYNITAVNTTGTLYYLRIYDTASGPTCSSATGLKLKYPIPASATGNGLSVTVNQGIAFSTGIGFCITAGSASNDNTSAATGVFLSAAYK
jgi:hypothetical protein